jgi:hypothetical protein
MLKTKGYVRFSEAKIPVRDSPDEIQLYDQWASEIWLQAAGFLRT